jgi:hypothetical protein
LSSTRRAMPLDASSLACSPHLVEADEPIAFTGHHVACHLRDVPGEQDGGCPPMSENKRD